MRIRRAECWQLCLAAGLMASESPVSAINIQMGSHGGVMQQPTSQYYHLVYGAYGQAASENESLLLRAEYIERPEFRAVGYADKDYGAFVLLGSKVTTTPNYGLAIMAGYGEMRGYTRSTNAETMDPLASQRSYRIPGLMAAAEFGAHWLGIDAALSHQLFIGYAGSQQLKSLVAWPYSFFLAKLGVSW